MENLCIKTIAFIKPTSIWFNSCGEYNGYIAIPKNNKYFGIDYNDIPVNVHGGLTFGEPSNDIITYENWLSNVEFLIGDKLPENYFVFGFDTCHFGDNPKIWNRDAVITETLKLQKQFDELINK